jgi:hypothetical protein
VSSCPPYQAVLGAPLRKNTPETGYARRAVEALLSLGQPAFLLDTSAIPTEASDAVAAGLLHQKLLEIRPPGHAQIYCNLVPDMWRGNTSMAGHLAYRSLNDTGLRVVNYVYEFAEGVRRYGEARALMLQMQQYPVGQLSILATSTEFEARLLGHYLTFPGGFSLLPWIVPRLNQTRVIPLPPIISPSPGTLEHHADKFRTSSPLRLVLLGGFRPYKGTNPDSGLGLYPFLDALGRLVQNGRLQNPMELHVAGRCFDTTCIEAIPGGIHAPLVRCLESLYHLNDTARNQLADWIDHPADLSRARILEETLLNHCQKYPFRIHLHLDREDAWLSEEVLGPAHLGLLLSLRGLSCRNSVLYNYAAHRIPILANLGEETPAHLAAPLIRAYDESDRETALAGGELEVFLARSMEKAAEFCVDALNHPERLQERADGLYHTLDQPSARKHAESLCEWYSSVLRDPVKLTDRWALKASWPLVSHCANRACRGLVDHPHPRNNPVQDVVNALVRRGWLRAPLSTIRLKPAKRPL